MTTGRLEAFSDGVMAIIITIMVLELKVPEGANFENLKPLIPKFISYLLSFAYVGIYWNNHHHLFQAVKKVDGKILWANLLLLLFLSVIPFTTGWMGENQFEKNPTALYGLNLLFCAFAFTLLEKFAIKLDGKNSDIGKALENRKKEMLSVFFYAAGIAVSFFMPLLSLGCYALVAILWLIPDTRIERQLKN